MLPNEDFLGVLKEAKLIKPIDVSEIEIEAQAKGTPAYYIVLERQLASDDQIAKTLAKFYGLPLAPLGKITIAEDVVRSIPEMVARAKLIIPFAKTAEGLKIATSDPKDLEIIEFIRKKTGDNILVHYATPRQIDDAIRVYQKDIKTAFKGLLDEARAEAKKTGRPVDVPIIKVVDMLLSYGNQNRASDIHIEPKEEESLMRFRIQGLLHDVGVLPKNIHQEMVTRVKVLAGLRTDEHFAAQDGKLSFRTGIDLPKERQEKMDVRVSIVPTTHGEKVVMRLLSARVRQYSLEDMGFSETDLKKLHAAYMKPYGMIIASGPTGSGKTTTMYAVLKLLNKRDINITTIEDPVEYDMEGVNQIPVNPKTGLTFATGLRSIVRQDPDIVLVGEIRDSETASIAVNAAMTGHLVLSTMHANDSATTLVRLLDMGVEPFLVASSVNVVVAQRLIRVLCPQCKVKKELATAELIKNFPAKFVTEHLGKGPKVSVYEAQGCSVCQNTGYVDRIGIHEVMLIDDEIRQAVIDRKSSDVVEDIAIKKGMITMLEDGFIKVGNGITTIEELLRVVKE